jgi:hypothetical protein
MGINIMKKKLFLISICFVLMFFLVAYVACLGYSRLMYIIFYEELVKQTISEALKNI